MADGSTPKTKQREYTAKDFERVREEMKRLGVKNDAVYEALRLAIRTMQRRYHKQGGGWKFDPLTVRPDETVGGGFFVFQRFAGTGRIRPSLWPYEYATEEAAIAQAERLAAGHEGVGFDVVAVIYGVAGQEP